MAIVALQQLEVEKRERGEPLLDGLQAFADAAVGANEMRGTGERHIRLLPTRPAFEVGPRICIFQHTQYARASSCDLRCLLQSLHLSE